MGKWLNVNARVRMETFDDTRASSKNSVTTRTSKRSTSSTIVSAKLK